MLYEIPEINVAALEKRLARLSARTVKAGNPPIQFRRTGAFRDEPSKASENVLVRLVEVEVTTETPAYNGWHFLATICQTDDGNVIRAVPGYAVPEEYRQGQHRCDHCNTVRNRRDTFIVRHDDGRTLRVGSSCLQDFLQHSAPKQLTKAAHMCLEAHSLAESAEHDSWLGGGMSQPWRIDTEEYLAHVAQLVLNDGYFVTSKAAAERGTTSTAKVALQLMTSSRREFEVKTAARELAQTAREWVIASMSDIDFDSPELSADDILNGLCGAATRKLNEFEHNLLVAARSEAIEPRLAGIAAFVVEAYRRSLPKPAVVESQFVGAPKERLRDVDVVFSKVVPQEADGFTRMYDKTFCVMHDSSGNVLVWSASGLQDFEPGKPYILTGTVKQHSTYKGVRQTILSRCIINPKTT